MVRGVFGLIRMMSFFSEETFELRTGSIDGCDVYRPPCTCPRLEVIAEVCAFLISYFLCSGFTTLLREVRLIVDTKLADVQLRPAFWTFVETP